MNWESFIQSLSATNDNDPTIVDFSQTQPPVSQQDDAEIDEDLMTALALLGLPMIAKNNE